MVKDGISYAQRNGLVAKAGGDLVVVVYTHRNADGKATGSLARIFTTEPLPGSVEA